MRRLLPLVCAPFALGCLPSMTQLGEPTHISAGDSPIEAVPADLNGDGKVDLIVVRSAAGSTSAQPMVTRGALSVMLGRGDGTFDDVFNTPGLTPKGPAIADFNGDGKPDLAVTDLVEGFVTILLGNGDGTFHHGVGQLVGRSGSSAKAADLNGDGKIDLVLVNFRPNSSSGGASEFEGSRLTVLLGHGDGTFEAARTRDLGRGLRGVTVADWDGDGKLDLAVADETDRAVLILYGHGDGTFEQRERISLGYQPVGVASADINNDGRRDLLVGISAATMVYLGSSDVGFVHSGDYYGDSTRSGTTADFNHDGRLDLATARRVLLGDGAGHFAGRLLSHPTNDDSFVAAADVNGDGWPDLVTTDRAHNRINVYLNQGNGTASTQALNAAR